MFYVKRETSQTLPGKVTYFVLDHDEAITFFVTKLGFELVEDTKIGETKRWVHIRAGCEGAGMVFALASEAQKEFVSTKQP